MRKLLISQKVEINRHGELIETLEASLIKYFNSLGAVLFPVSNFTNSVEDYISCIEYEGLILSGGGDVNPDFITTSEEKSFSYFPERDKTEYFLINNTIVKKMPILGICHGMQVLNCYFGGKITANIHSGESNVRKPRLNHSITINKDIFGFRGNFEINHYHDHGIRRDQVASVFNIFAVDAEYNVVEGIIHKDLQILGISWHPERNSPDSEFNKHIIKSFFKI
jgi:gamma-glutamyl-gamma-aminobutyrate hydrolase PuuD